LAEALPPPHPPLRGTFSRREKVAEALPPSSAAARSLSHRERVAEGQVRGGTGRGAAPPSSAAARHLLPAGEGSRRPAPLIRRCAFPLPWERVAEGRVRASELRDAIMEIARRSDQIEQQLTQLDQY